jgi:hypothetical protein
MNSKLIYWGLTALILVGGCIPSLNPAYRQEDLVFDAAALGVWTQEDGKARWEFTKRDDQSYQLLYTDQEGQQGRFIAHLAKIDGTLFLDLFPEEAAIDVNSFYKFHLVPIHTIYLVRQTKPKLELSAIDYKWLDQELSKTPATIQTSTFNGRKLITAPTDDVRAFVSKHKDSFTAEFKLQRQAAAN